MVLIGSNLSLVSFTSNFSEIHKDCIDAFKICHLADYHVEAMSGYGDKELLDIENSNLEETNSHWFQLEASISGELEFVIVPDNSNDDIDFILYEGSQCTNKKPKRLMTSGEVVGVESRKECIGQTGLQRISNDIEEKDGCFDLDDNFLKPVYLEQDNTYFLLVNNFNSSNGFTILFSGDESLELVNTCNKEIDEELIINLYPNPTNDFLTVAINKIFPSETKIDLFNQSGRLFYSNTYESILEKCELNVSTFPSGKYFVRVSSESEVGLKSFVKI